MAGKVKAEPVTIPFISDDDHYINDLSFFIHLTLTFQKTPYLIPAIFWTVSENKNHLLFFFPNKPLPNNFIDLICKRNDENLFVNNAGKQNINSTANSFKNLLNMDTTLKEFLKTL
jgi:hypothetical protein